VLHLDATTIRADLDANRVGEPDSPDADARFGRGPGGAKIPSFKQQTVVDSRSRVVVGVAVTAGNAPDQVNAQGVVHQACAQVGRSPEAVCADSGYATGANRRVLGEQGIRLVSPPPPATRAGGMDLFVVTDFTYDERRDVFTCPAGQDLEFVRIAVGRRLYRAAKATCAACPLQARCTRRVPRTLRVTLEHRGAIDLRRDSASESFRALYRTRAPVIEGIFAEAKQWHGLRRAWRRGLSNMRMQCWLVAAVLNFKRLAAVIGSFLPFGKTTCVAFAALQTAIQLVTHAYRHLTRQAVPIVVTP
jgi:hypothetical protein